MANTLTCAGKTGVLADDGSKVTFSSPNHPGRFYGGLYIKYDKGNGTSVSVAVAIKRRRLSIVDEYLDSYLASSVNVTQQTYDLAATGNHYQPLDNLPKGDLDIICTPTFTGGTTQSLNLEFLPN